MANLAYAPASRLVKMIKSREITSQELLNFYIKRMEVYNPGLNIIVATNLEHAQKRAQEADEAIEKGIIWGPLHGLPITIKDAYEVVGMPATAGAARFKNHYPVKNADLVEKLLTAGAIIYGKTNMPYLAADWQSYNKIYGITNNPWDKTKTPGGSSGGSAASLAADFSSLEVGSDLNGSTRIPAHFCGVYGHRVTQGIVSLRGHIPGEPGDISIPDLAAAGLLARTAEDLELLLKVISGPEDFHNVGWSLDLPKPKPKALSDYKVIAWLDDEFCSIDREIKDKYQKLVERLKEVGVDIIVAKPTGYDLEELFDLMIILTGCMVSSSLTPVQSVATRLLIFFLQLFAFGKHSKNNVKYLKAMLYSHRKWQLINEDRLRLQRRYCKLFDNHNILLTPITPWTAIAHNPNFTQAKKVIVNSQKRNYLDHIGWNSIATILGLPSTSAPIGVHSNGLPINIQVTAAPYHDYMTLDFCKKMERITGGFTPPYSLSQKADSTPKYSTLIHAV